MRGFFILYFTMQRFFLSFAALSGLSSVALGAFAAHGLKHSLTAESLVIFHTGAEYQMYHSLALLLTALLVERNPRSRALRLAGGAFLAGILLFSGSLYALALGAAKQWGIITPFGGLSFLLGWTALVAYGIRR
ncbi:MAG TPA: DUF423 domain-containing protein [Cellvibrio sp.]|nr:DUF423 domain-containing protein [Cellvibrio sp.]